MSKQIERFRSRVTKALIHGQTWLEETLKWDPSAEKKAKETREIERAKGSPPDYTIAARLSSKERERAKSVGQRVISQRIIREVRDKLW